jgi:hypothetical protein
VLVIAAALIIAAIAGPVVAAVAELVRVLLVIVAVLAGLAVIAAGAWLATRRRRIMTRSAISAYYQPPVPRRTAQAVSAPRPRQLSDRGTDGALHLHFHGVSAEEVAAILARHRAGSGGEGE